jgi:hypothetical protein
VGHHAGGIDDADPVGRHEQRRMKLRYHTPTLTDKRKETAMADDKTAHRVEDCAEYSIRRTKIRLPRYLRTLRPPLWLTLSSL